MSDVPRKEAPFSSEPSEEPSRSATPRQTRKKQAAPPRAPPPSTTSSPPASTPPLSDQTDAGDRRLGDREGDDRRWWLLGGALAILLATVAALLQPYRPDADRDVTGWRRWLYPAEQNAWKRIPELTNYVGFGYLMDVTPVPQANDIVIQQRDREYTVLTDPRDHGAGERVRCRREACPAAILASATAAAATAIKLVAGDKPIAEAAFSPDGKSIWVAGEPYWVARSGDGGKTFDVRQLGDPLVGGKPDSILRAGFMDVFFASKRDGWALADDAIYATHDAGASWVPLERPTTGMATIAFADDAKHGWLASHAIVWRTDDGAASWYRTMAVSAFFPGPHVSDSGQELWAQGYNGCVYRSRDFGDTWTTQCFADFLEGLHVSQDFAKAAGEGLGGRFWYTLDHAATWHDTDHLGIDRVLPHGDTLDSDQGALAPVPANERDAVIASIGHVLGVDWSTPSHVSGAGVTPSYADVRFISPTEGWAVGRHGLILHTTNGRTWETVESAHTDIDWYGIAALPDRKHIWLFGDQATILRSTDWGGHWTSVEHRRSLPGWYFVVCLTVCLMIARRVRRAPATPQATEGIQDILVTDRPIETVAEDRLGLRTTAAALSRFIRNQSTRPPITIAINGDWGTGKSSVMRLLAADLEESQRLKPVWFNAWHHETSDNVLAHLFDMIIKDGVPRWSDPAFLAFRWRLVAGRVVKRAFLMITTLVLLGLVAAYLLGNDTATHTAQWLVDVLRRSAALKDAFGSHAEQVALRAPAATTIGLLAAIAVNLKTIVTEIVKAFGVEPADLLKFASLKADKKDASSVTEFRARFSEDLGEVTEALGQDRLVIFIDDLDRCMPANVLKVLDAVNFLAESGDCFIVLGLSRKVILRSVGLGFQAISEESVDELRPDAADEANATETPSFKRTVHHAYATKYLEKLINIEVSLPPLTDSSVAGLLGVSGESEPATNASDADDLTPEPAASWHGLVSQARRVLPTTTSGRAMGVMCLGGLLALGAGSFEQCALPNELGEKVLTEQQPDGGPGTVDAGSPAVTAPPPEAAKATAAHLVAPKAENHPLQIAHPTRGATTWWPIVATVVVLLLSIVLLWAGRRPPAIIDAPAFTAALKASAPLILAAAATPRGVKRFMNQTRFYAALRDTRDDWKETLPHDWLVYCAAAERAVPGVLKLADLSAMAGAMAGEDEQLRRGAMNLLRDAATKTHTPVNIIEQYARTFETLSLSTADAADVARDMVTPPGLGGADRRRD